ncbi:MAG: CidA/LrgA family protein [Pseudomonadales bacterium]|nr:CidA/LrgA family protein [Pseudomonadales bacterium]
MNPREGWQAALAALVLFAYFVLGQVMHVHVMPTVPPAVLGMLLLLGTLFLLGRVPSWLERGIQMLLRHFTLFLLPPTVGILAIWPEVRSHAAGFLLTLVLATLIPLYFGAWCFQYLTQDRRNLG